MAAEGNDPELRLLRYLYVGKDYANYQPGYWFAHHYFIVRNVLAIEELAENEEKQLVPIELITNAFESNLVTHPEALVFALAVCCRQNKSEILRHAAYENVKKICASTPNFILFVKFVSKLCREKDLNYITQGWGQGLRKAINNWYLSKNSLEFIECVTKYRSRYGWKHKDIVKMAHPNGNSPENKIILKYVIYGLEKTKKDIIADQITETPDITKLLEYMKNIEDFKHCEDELEAARKVEINGFSLDHVPGQFLKSKEVWNSLVMSMDVVALLNNLQRIHNLGCLGPDEPAVEKVTERLTDSHCIESSAVHPALIFITLKNYECSGKFLTYEKRKVRELAKKPEPPKYPNLKITDALKEAFRLSFKNIQSTKLRYLVTISTNKAMETSTWQNGNMTGLETAALIALTLLRSEENVTIATFRNVGIYIVNVQGTDSYDDILNAIRSASRVHQGSTNPSKPILWAKNKPKQYDVFINIMDQIFQKHDESQEHLISYKEDQNLPDTKLITCALCSSSPYRKTHDRHVLTINGFDATVPNVIQAFARGLF
ncbi:PREDICTED: 60 kDa SS-A/Ro ribonucleoprotein-like [Wasmannia auropunctata]|uniref:60 kDa SS-A/Ro ribonucleoprotein-like n=1 Tax=Wasmannia auropunctata TaxID=64793 RepID=UPI0005EEF3FB|nr:PREDICTED: 60 kDa SS-A/Ro ribonucleoprotein-like [Wasmannia auropunctata]XP_011708162.1 PREDICTED: 60 kDa SS-A/Ro ribonucleoprotein-like [Wasmannia auropunctata]XP_011708163.1 PREDICTED: 60 kDa SS-A/Ro ribonucleoprotein-like [Wasmannia auropunctata]